MMMARTSALSQPSVLEGNTEDLVPITLPEPSSDVHQGLHSGIMSPDDTPTTQRLPPTIGCAGPATGPLISNRQLPKYLTPALNRQLQEMAKDDRALSDGHISAGSIGDDLVSYHTSRYLYTDIT